MVHLPNEIINIIFSYRQLYPYIKELNDSINQHKSFHWYDYKIGGINIYLLLMIIKNPNKMYYSFIKNNLIKHCGK
jgi:hypothetical protein